MIYFVEFSPQILNLVAMAIRLENLCNVVEIPDPKNTQHTSKNFEGAVHMTGVMVDFVQFCLSNPKFGCHNNPRLKI